MESLIVIFSFHSVKQDEEEEERVLSQCDVSNKADCWLRLERSRQASHWLPWRPSANETDEDCEDPHRLILSDDFIDLLFYIEGRMLLVFEPMIGIHSPSEGTFLFQLTPHPISRMWVYLYINNYIPNSHNSA